MAGQDIVQNMIRMLGQSQGDRMPAALAEHYADVDERSTADFFEFLRKFAFHLKYYRDDSTTSSGDWSAFFPFDEGEAKSWLAQQNSSTPAHLALMQAFFELYQYPQKRMNKITGRHLDFYYQDVLRFEKKPAVPDKAHLLLELKKNAGPCVINQEHLFWGGKDAAGVERIYRPTAETVVNATRVASLRSLYVDHTGDGVVRYAPIADSSDGLGGELSRDEPKWYGFGSVDLPTADTGFALSSPVLRMKEGVRRIEAELTLDNVNPDNLKSADLNQAFIAYLTGEKTWLGPYTVIPSLEGPLLTLIVKLGAEDGAVVDYESSIHGYAFSSNAPLMQLFLNTEAGTIGYKNFQNVYVKDARILVDVSGVKSLQLENDAGTLNPAKAFMPFGPQPDKDSRFLVGYPEAFAKKLSSVGVKIDWKGAPDSMSSHYSNYGEPVSNSYFKASVSFNDAGNQPFSKTGQTLFDSENAQNSKTIYFSTSVVASQPANDAGVAYALASNGSSWAQSSLNRLLLHRPVFLAASQTAVEATKGFMTFSLDKGFLHDRYRRVYVEKAMEFSKGTDTDITLINEPYTPVIQGIEFSYKACTESVSIDSNALAAFAKEDLHFFTLGYFGQMRDHGYQRHLFDYVKGKQVPLLPQYKAAGELLIGFENLSSGDSVSVLFQMAEGSSDPQLPRENVAWSVLCDNYWKTLEKSEVVLDTTHQLLKSGLIKFVIPKEATCVNTIMPSGYVWLKAVVQDEVTAVCQLIEVAANAIEVQFADNKNDSGHLESPLPAKSITKLKTGISSIKKVSQPYASFDNAVVEHNDAFRTRVAERLRHKNRAVSAWDIERLVLSEFPSIHKVKCIPHAKLGQWLAPGNVMVVVIPDLTKQNAIDPLQPRVPSHTLSKILALLESRGGMQVQYHVANPSYQKIKLDFKVKLKTGYEFNYYSSALNRKIVRNLCPWAYGENRDICFYGRLYKTVLLNFIEEVEYVDYVTDFKMYSYISDAETMLDSNEVVAHSPDAILVSSAEHNINEYGQV